MKKYPRWIIRKFVPVPGRVYLTLASGQSSLWEIGYVRHENDKLCVSLRRPTYEEVREIYVAGTVRRNRQNATPGP